jgi:lipopolysaccharide biosynthesis glycosyltransferase
MNKIPIVFTFNKQVILGGAVSIKSLIDNALPTTTYDIYVLHPDISTKTISDFESILKDSNHKISFKQIDKKKFDNLPINTKRGWAITFYRLLIPELLTQYKKVIYSDVDVLFNTDMTEVYSTNLDNYEWAGVKAEKHEPNMVSHKYFEENNKSHIYWPGFMVINTELMRKTHFLERCYSTMYRFNTRLKFRDLDVINLTCNNIKAIPFKYCTLQSIFYLNNIQDAEEYSFLKSIYSDEELVESKNNPAIIHYAGKPGKPWARRYMPEEYKKYVNIIPKKLRKYTFRDIRRRFFSKF